MNDVPRTLLRFSGVSKRFCRRPELRGRLAAIDIAREFCGLPTGDRLRNGEFWSLRDIDLEVVAGEVLGVIGHNGAGKSTLMGLAAGILRPTTGTITRFVESVCKIDPFSLMNPMETGRENIVLQLVYRGVPAADLDAEVDAIAAFADLADRLDETVGTYSTGMRGRLGFAIFSRLRPDVFLVDEAIGGGDRRFRDQFRGFLDRYVADGGAMMLCVHDAQTIQSLCHRVLLLDQGRGVLTADPATAIEAYNRLAAERGALPMPVFRSPQGRRRDAGGPAAATPDGGSPAAGPSPALDIDTLRITGVDGGELVPGAAAEIKIHCTAAAPVEGVACIVEIGRGGWFPLAAIQGPPTTIRPEGNDLCCHVATLPLAPGRYDAHVSLVDADSGLTLVDTRGRDPFRFHVRAGAASRRVATERGPVIHVTASWGDPPVSGERLVSSTRPS